MFIRLLLTTNIVKVPGRCTWAEEDQAGPQSRQLNVRLKVMDLHDAENLTHGHVQLIQAGRPDEQRKRESERRSMEPKRL